MEQVPRVDEFFMQEGIKEAEKGAVGEEGPNCAGIEIGGEIIARAHNLRETRQNAVAHAELLAIEEACRKTGSWRLEGATLYVTLEPCAMCAGAIVLSRVERVVYATPDPKGGCAGTLMNLLDESRFNHQCEVVPGVMEAECAEMLSGFFRELRERKKEARRLARLAEMEKDTGFDS